MSDLEVRGEYVWYFAFTDRIMIVDRYVDDVFRGIYKSFKDVIYIGEL